MKKWESVLCREAHLFLFIIIASILIEGCAEESKVDTSAAQRNLQLGWKQYNAGKYTEAVLSFERSTNLDESISDAYNGLGWAKLSTSQNPVLNLSVVEEAMADFSEAIKRDDKNADAWVGLANTLFLRRLNQSDFEKAIKAIDIAMQQANQEYLYRHDYQSEAELHALKSACYFYLNDKSSAKAEMNATLKIKPQNQTVVALRQLM